jgi:hypothetical protein
MARCGGPTPGIGPIRREKGERMPRSVAIVGASRDRSKFGNKAVRAYRQIGDRVYPIHPKENEIEGLPVFPSVRAVPDRIDRVALYVSAAIGLSLLEEIAERLPVELYLSPGSESPELIRRARELGLEPIERCPIREIGIDPDTLDGNPIEETRP